MVDKKAFTLVELLGVIVILGLILVVTVPNIINTMKNNKIDEAGFLKIMVTAAEFYVQDNIDSYEFTTPEDKYSVLITDLINNGYLKANLVNPNTETEIKYESSYVEIYKDNEGFIIYNYIYQE